MTDNEASVTEDPTCPYCGDTYAAARAEIGYNFCMKKPCADRGKEEKGSKPIEIEVVQAENRF